MGTDPRLDWSNPPFRRDRSPVAVADEYGFGTPDLEQIDFEMDSLEPLVAEFGSVENDPAKQIVILRRTASEQALFYRDHCDQILKDHADSYIFLQGDDVIWSGAQPERAGPAHQVAAARPDQAVWLKLADPREREGEHMEVYEKILAAS
jgi:hypothetical protein